MRPFCTALLRWRPHGGGHTIAAHTCGLRTGTRTSQHDRMQLSAGAALRLDGSDRDAWAAPGEAKRSGWGGIGRSRWRARQAALVRVAAPRPAAQRFWPGQLSVAARRSARKGCFPAARPRALAQPSRRACRGHVAGAQRTGLRPRRPSGAPCQRQPVRTPLAHTTPTRRAQASTPRSWAAGSSGSQRHWRQ